MLQGLVGEHLEDVSPVTKSNKSYIAQQFEGINNIVKLYTGSPLIK